MNAPASLGKTMRHVDSVELVDFSEIYNEQVEMVSVTVPQTETVHSAIAALLSESSLQAQWIQGGGANTEANNTGRPERVVKALHVLREDIALPVEVLTELLGCESCGVRIKVLEGPMCPRFHVDRVPCRMLMTYAGPGTEWIANQDVDWPGFAKGTPSPTVEGARIRSMAAGAWCLLKGGTWDSEFGGVVHRSPSEVERRLLVTLDPIFPN